MSVREMTPEEARENASDEMRAHADKHGLTIVGFTATFQVSREYYERRMKGNLTAFVEWARNRIGESDAK